MWGFLDNLWVEVVADVGGGDWLCELNVFNGHNWELDYDWHKGWLAFYIQCT